MIGKTKEKFITFSFVIFLLIITFYLAPIRLNTQTNEEIEFKIFLNAVLQNDFSAKEKGYSFIEKYPDSHFISDIYYYLSFVEDDYFRNIVNLKKIILNYPYSIWREPSAHKLLTLYFLNNNKNQFNYWYDFYQQNFQTKNRRWQIEMLNLKMLYKNKDYSNLETKIEYHLQNAKNYELLSYCLLLKASILREKQDIKSTTNTLLTALTMFPDSSQKEGILLNLFEISHPSEKPIYAKYLINTRTFYSMSLKQKEDVIYFSNLAKEGSFLKVEDKTLYRDYYYISLGFTSDNSEIEKLVNTLKTAGVDAKKIKVNETVYQLIAGYFHYKKDALEVLKKIISININSSLSFIDYAY